MKNLAENKYGHGAKKGWLKTKLGRLTRSRIAKAGIPFDWETGFDIEKKIGVIATKNQAQASSCGGEAGSYFIGAVDAFLSAKPYIEQSAKSVYAPIFYPGGGTTVPALENQIAKNGSLDESILPSYYTNGSTDESLMEDRSWMTSANLKLAMEKAGWTVKSVAIDIESIAEAIRDYGGVIWEIAGQNNGTWLSANPKPPVNNKNLWNHFMYSGAAVLQNSIKTIKSMQSWGPTIGEGGRQYFGEDYIDSGYIYDVFTFVKNPTPAPIVSDITYKETGPEVVSLQKRLGMPILLQTGYYGFLTLCAVVKFEIANKLPITDTIGAQMRLLLNV